MAQRILTPGAAHTARPFSAEGVSLYVTAGKRVVYRHLRVVTGGTRRRRRAGWIKGTAGRHDVAGGITKTARRAHLLATAGGQDIDWTLPGDLIGQEIAIDVRRHRADVENTTDNYRTRRLAIDGSGDSGGEILGVAQLRTVEPRAGGVCRITIDFAAARDGVQPAQFRAVATAGPTSPDDVVVAWSGGRTIVIDTPALLDSAPYTYRVDAENEATVSTLIADIAVQADATGPPAPIDGTAEAT